MSESEESARSGPEAAPDLARGRRSFLRQLSGDAVWTAGRLAGASAIIRRSLVAAGETAVRGLESPAGSGPPVAVPTDSGPPVAAPTDSGPPVAAPADSVSSPSHAPDPPIPAVGAAASGPVTGADAISALTPAQHAFLSGGEKAALAVNDPAGPPLVTSSMYHWDGSVLRLPAQDFSARAINVDRDPRVSVLIEDATTEAWVAVTGIASLVYGDQVEREMLQILEKYLDPDTAIRRWNALRSSGDRIVILVRPTRFVWRPAQAD